jgi:hypothetical protein
VICRYTLLGVFYTWNTTRETELRLFQFLSRQNAIKAVREWSGGLTPHILNLFAGWTYLVIFIFRSFIAGKRASGARLI